MLPIHIRRSLAPVDPVANIYLTQILDTMLPWTTPAILTFFYTLTAYFAGRDVKENTQKDTNSEAQSPQPNNPPDNHNDETQPTDNKAQKFFDKAGKTLEQSLEVGGNLLKSSQAFVKQKIDEVKSHKESAIVNDKKITLAVKPEGESKYQESLKLHKTIVDSYSQNTIRLNDYRKLVDIFVSIGDYKNSKDIADDILEKLKNIRSRLPEERLKARLELQQMIENLENMLIPEEIEIPQHDHELKYHEALTVKESIEKYYSQNRVRPQDYSKLFEILSEIGDYKDAREITANTLTKLKNMRSKLSAELLKKKPELQKLQQILDKLIEKFSNI